MLLIGICFACGQKKGQAAHPSSKKHALPHTLLPAGTLVPNTAALTLEWTTTQPLGGPHPRHAPSCRPLTAPQHHALLAQHPLQQAPGSQLPDRTPSRNRCPAQDVATCLLSEWIWGQQAVGVEGRRGDFKEGGQADSRSRSKMSSGRVQDPKLSSGPWGNTCCLQSGVRCCLTHGFQKSRDTSSALVSEDNHRCTGVHGCQGWKDGHRGGGEMGWGPAGPCHSPVPS